MKKILGIVVLGLLLSGNAYAGVNEPGVTSIAGCDKSLKYQFKKIKKKQTLFSMQVVTLVAILMLIIKVKI